MKKDLLKLTVLLLVLCQLLTLLWGCAVSDKAPVTTDEAPITETDTADVNITKTNISQYSIVVPENSSDGAMAVAMLLQSYIKEALGVELEIRTDYVREGSDEYYESEYEILVGNTARAETEELYKTLGERDSGYCMIKSKLLICGLSKDALTESAELWRTEILSTATEVIMTHDMKKINIKEKLSLSVMTYNVLYSNSDVGIQNMITSIKSIDSDIFGCNEIQLNITMQFNAALSSEYGYIRSEYVNPGNPTYNAIFYKKDKLELLESGTYWLTDTPTVASKYEGGSQQRNCAWGVFKDKESGVSFVYMQTHLEHAYNEYSLSIRGKQAEALKNIANTYYPDLPVIIGGDFNCSNVADVAPLVTDSRFVNSSDITDKRIGSATWAGENSSTLGTSTLDYIFVTEDLITVSHHEAVDNKIDGTYPSDHIPVLIKVNIYN